ncbi:xanthine dehydrogenase family protein molybdopterin-binding subunit [Pusillimonas noertemannii]|uniref:xanthine dehydrogenase family protein molybdopterin-binding subunit n=1 Tax=Pusillimonas noertemannii TaxID=305977 RepID=UPI0002D69514|nr:molybdopterin cofactor-binding domain-containing protein [Pusillimonas noertemannii]
MDNLSSQVPAGVSRRQFLAASGALIVSFGLPLQASAQSRSVADGSALQFEAGPWDDTVDKKQLDSWLAVLPDGSVAAGVGKIEAGMGISTAFAQIVADELDVPLDKVAIHMGDTATTVDQRGTGSSNGIMDGGSALRKASAQARHALLSMASVRLGVPAEQLEVEDGVVKVAGTPGKSISYGELIGGKRFEMALDAKVRTKDASQYKLVGKPVPRTDIPLKVTGQYVYLVDHRVPGMLHGRVIRPPKAGARLLEVPAGQSFPGLVKVVSKGDYVAVVCEREEQAVKAARELKVEWSTPEPMFAESYDALYDSLRSAQPKQSKTEGEAGDVEAAMAGAAKVVRGQYEYPFQSHACMGPGCAIADVRDDGAQIWSGGQKPYPLRRAVAELLGMDPEQVRTTWMPGPGSYGMNDADDAAMDAALLSRETGKPVRVQYMRADGTAWDAKGPPIAFNMRGALDEQGKVLAFDYEARGYSSRVRPSGTDHPGDTLSVYLRGEGTPASTEKHQFPEDSYEFPNQRRVSHLFEWRQSLPTGLRTTHLRDPDGMATCFASECFIDELAAEAGADPVEFRLAYLKEPRDRAVVEAVAKAAGWDRRPSPRKGQEGPEVTGRGIAYSPRKSSVVALVAEVKVNMETGRFRVTRFVVAHDCGFVINPLGLDRTIEGNLLMGMSRAMYEEVRFTSDEVKSVDWASYPIAEIDDVPDRMDVVMVNNRPDAKPGGAGEPTIRPVAAVIANALFDATGVRIRRVPFTPENLRAAFKAHAAAT